jgi:hypothetical protein
VPPRSRAVGDDVAGRDVDGRDVDGRDVDGRDVDGRDVDGRDVDARDVDTSAVDLAADADGVVVGARYMPAWIRAATANTSAGPVTSSVWTPSNAMTITRREGGAITRREGGVRGIGRK